MALVAMGDVLKASGFVPRMAVGTADIGIVSSTCRFNSGNLFSVTFTAKNIVIVQRGVGGIVRP